MADSLPLDLREMGMALWDEVSKAQAVQSSKRKPKCGESQNNLYAILEFAL